MKQVKSVHLELTNLCNLSCVMCPVNRKMKRENQVMPFSLVKKIVRENPQLVDFGLNNWGEPMLHPKFFEIIEYLKDRGKRVSFATNATLLTEEASKKLISLNVDKISFSVDAVGRDYEKIRGFSYEKVKHNILCFLKWNKFTNVKIVVTLCKDNEHLIEEIKEEWKNIDIHVQPMLTFKKDNRKHRCKQLYDSHLVVLSNGWVVPCCADYEGVLKIGDARDQSLNEILNSLALQNLRKDSSNCAYCSEFESEKASFRFKSGLSIYSSLLSLFSNVL